MQFPEHSCDWAVVISAAADLSMRPWKHSVVDRSNFDKQTSIDNSDDLLLLIKCRSAEGERQRENDLEIDIYRSGSELNIMLAWSNKPEHPILWQGQHAVWMDSNTGKRIQAPIGGASLEALARRIRAYFP